MSSRCLDRIGLVAALLASVPAAPARAEEAAQPLRVCADPDNLPYSRRDGSGFELRIAQLLAAELKRPLEVYWLPQRRGFVRKTVGEDHCDAWMGVPAGFERLLTTRPYYRSGYVFVSRVADAQPLRAFDDPRLPALRIGVQLIGNDLAATPPGHALARRGAVQRVRGYTIDGGDGPAAQRIAQALADGQLDAALVWGPQAGYFAEHAPQPLQVSLAHAPEGMTMPFEFGIAVGVRKGDQALRDALQAALDAHRAEVDAVLAEYAVPRTDRPEGAR